MQSNPQKPAAQAMSLLANVVDSLPDGALQERLAAARAEARPLRVKLGIDPTAPDIHLGHAVVLRKLREFQDHGHRVVLIVGDTTAQVGDPSGRSTLRPILSTEEIERNAASFHEQALKILDPSSERLEIRRNGEWLQMALGELLALMRTTTVAQILERDDFAKRLAAGQPVSVLEMMYPLLQGYDSVAVRADVELGGTDQKFNLLLGRDIQRAYGQPGQAIVTMPILVGVDGKRKMSKSLGNHIGITDEPAEMYGKTMSIPDAAMEEYFRLLLGRETPTDLGPRDAKRLLARECRDLAARSAAGRRTRRRRSTGCSWKARSPRTCRSTAFTADGEPVHLPGLIAEAFGLSRSEARRMFAQGAVQLGDRRLGAKEQDVPAEQLDGQVLRVGRRRFCRLRVA